MRLAQILLYGVRGFIEYFSLAFGLKSLYVIAILVYFPSFASMRIFK